MKIIKLTDSERFKVNDAGRVSFEGNIPAGAQAVYAHLLTEGPLELGDAARVFSDDDGLMRRQGEYTPAALAVLNLIGATEDKSQRDETPKDIPQRSRGRRGKGRPVDEAGDSE